jgi:hypothetical protein
MVGSQRTSLKAPLTSSLALKPILRRLVELVLQREV